MAGDNLLGKKDLSYHPVTSMFSWTITIKFFPKSGIFTPDSSFLFYGFLNS